MDESRKIALRETLYILIGVSVLTAAMFGIYGLLGRFDLSVLLGGIVGVFLSVGNFFFMAVAATLAADKAENRDVRGGTFLLRMSYPVRFLVLAGLLLVCGFSKLFNPLALVLPLAFVRPMLTFTAFFRKR